MSALAGRARTTTRARSFTYPRAPVSDWWAGYLPNPEAASAGAATAELLALLRAGEQSAQATFSRLVRRLPQGSACELQSALVNIGADEARHDQLLSVAGNRAGVVQMRPPTAVRRFFLHLESREIGVHLARIASLDACVCQTLAAVLNARPQGLHAALVLALAEIRRDEGRHVKLTKSLAQSLDVSPALLRDVGAETRYLFDAVLTSYDIALSNLGADILSLHHRIRRDDC